MRFGLDVSDFGRDLQGGRRRRAGAPGAAGSARHDESREARAEEAYGAVGRAAPGARVRWGARCAGAHIISHRRALRPQRPSACPYSHSPHTCAHAPTYRLVSGPRLRLPQHTLTISPAHRHDPPAACSAITCQCAKSKKRGQTHIAPHSRGIRHRSACLTACYLHECDECVQSQVGLAEPDVQSRLRAKQRVCHRRDGGSVVAFLSGGCVSMCVCV
jgi:hypothetical protein